MMLSVGILLAGTLSYTFWPRAVVVDMAEVMRAPMIVTIDEEAKTRVRDAYVVSAPIAGRIRRVEVEPGDSVMGGVTIIARMLPLNPSALDVRTREQARAAVSAAEAATRVARADLNKTIADKELAELDLARTRELRRSGTVSQAALERAEQVWLTANASFDMAKAAISMREAELANARARLISFNETADFSETPTISRTPGEKDGKIYEDVKETPSGAGKNIVIGTSVIGTPTTAATHTDENEIPRTVTEPTRDETIPLKAPVSGRILQVMQKSETTLAAGTPILEIGDIANDLEIVAEMLSTDAVQISPGMRVIIDKWGQDRQLSGVVERVEPWGFTKFSALGVEEQRVNTIIKFTDPIEKRKNLGHGFRVEIQVVIWESDAVLSLPASALFREKGGWAVFAVVDGKAKFKAVNIGRSNGIHAEIIDGLAPGEKIILYPGPAISNGTLVKQRQVE
jgi:HlyD family secretion protein